MKLSSSFLLISSAQAIGFDWVNNWMNQVFSSSSDWSPSSLSTGEHPSILCLDDSEIDLTSCLEVAGVLYAATCRMACSNDRDVCVGSHKTSTTTMRSCKRSICSPTVPILFNGKCSPACLKAHQMQYTVDKEGPYCATNGEKYTTKFDLYRDACAKEEVIEIDDQCIAHYQKMVEFHTAELKRWTEMLNKASVETEENAAVIVDVTIMGPDDEPELSVEADTPATKVCPSCPQRYRPICASQMVNGEEQSKTFMNEDCLTWTNCDQNQNWAIITRDICEHEKDTWRQDELVQPVELNDDYVFQIPIEFEQ